MTEPTDAEIFVVAREAGLLPDNSHPAPETRAARKHSNAVQAFARAVLAKWGTPVVAGEPVAWRQGSLTTVNQDPYPSLGDWFVQFWEGDDVAARVYGNDMETLRRRCAVIATQQPTQAQAGAVPLTDIRKVALDLYTPPFRHEYGYIRDANHQMVADDAGSEGSGLIASRIRGWGRIQYMDKPEQRAAALQDEVAEIVAEALNSYWASHGIKGGQHGAE